METTIATITDVSRHFSDYINKTVYRRENFILTRGGKAVAQLTPLPATKTLGELLDIVESLPKLSNEELSEFTIELRDLRRSSGIEENSSWDS